MASVNKVRSAAPVFTHGGVPAVANIGAVRQLRRTVLSCLLWENEFYEDGKSIADRISETAAKVDTQTLADLIVETRTVHNLRHVPLLLLCELVKRGGRTVGDAVYDTIQRADELAELLAIYWRDGKKPIPKQMKLGLARAFGKFNEYQLAKYDRQHKDVRLRDVLFMVHARPKDGVTAGRWAAAVNKKDYKRGEVKRHSRSVFTRLVNNELKTPDTWEVALSGGADKKETFERLLREDKLGYFALLRNLRNMVTAGVDSNLIKAALMARKNGADKILPFRYIAAARACPQMEPAIDTALQAAIKELPPLPGQTIVMVDVSGSMFGPLSGKSDLQRADAAAALGAIINGDVRLFTFSDALVEVPARRGMAGVDAILKSQPHGGTALAKAVRQVNGFKHDRLIVITDEQATDSRLVAPTAKHAYMINVASYKNGVGYGAWQHIDGFSENVLRWIHEFEKDETAA